MKCSELIRELRAAGCILERHGAGHDVYRNPAAGHKQSVPQHTEIRGHPGEAYQEEPRPQELLAERADPRQTLGATWRGHLHDVNEQPLTPARCGRLAPPLCVELRQVLDGRPAILGQRGIAVVIIDTPPALLDVITTTIAVADLVVIPCRPSPHDLRAVGVVVAMCQKAYKPHVMVLNAELACSRLAVDVGDLLHTIVSALKAIIHQR